MDRTILVATDGSADAGGALRTAFALAERDGSPVEVLALFEPFGRHLLGYPLELPSAHLAAEVAQAEALRGAVQAQVRALGGPADRWTVRVEAGSAAGTIARVAAERAAGLLLLGAARRPTPERWLGADTVLDVVRLATAPVVAVRPDAETLPQKALAAVDFGLLSLAAARAAAEMLAPGGELHLAHAAWCPPEGQDAPWCVTYRAGARWRLEELAEELARDFGVRVVPHVVAGDTPRELLRYAEWLRLGLLAAGSHGQGKLGRLEVGSVSTRLVRAAPCSVLLAPPTRAPAVLRRLARSGEREPALA